LRFEDEGAAMAASSIVLMAFSLTGLAAYLRMLRRANMVLIGSLAIDHTSKIIRIDNS
jgi:hypothetical protein